MKHLRFLLPSLALSASLLFPLSSLAQNSSSAILSKISIGDTESVNNEFIEIYNPTDKTLDVSRWKLRKKTSTGSISSIASIDTCVFLPPKKHFLWSNTNGRFATDADKTTTASLATNNTFELLDQNDTVIDSFAWDSNNHDAQSAERNPEALTWEFAPFSQPTGHEYVCQETVAPQTISAPTSGSSTVRLNEILPDPANTQEFVELFNFGTTDIDLTGWSLHDGSKTGKYTFKNIVIKAQSYLTIFRDDLSFALNNTDETVTIFDANDSIVDTIEYTESNENVSYNFSPSGWRWSGIVTPGFSNQFTQAAHAKTDIPKDIYKDMPASFTAKIKGGNSKTKYTWDFGDGHKSYAASATHTYAETGSYTVTLTATDSVEDVLKTFEIKVRKFPNAKLSITGIYPNPQGTDTDNEWISVRNQGKKKVDLEHWSIATGTSRATLTNHHVNGSLIVKPGETVLIPNTLSSFSLPNKEGFIELRQPNKKSTDSLHYAKPDGIKEGEQYQQSADKNWVWTPSNAVASEDTDQPLPIDEDMLPAANAQSDILDMLDTLSVDELSSLKTHIEEKILLATNQKTTPPDRNPFPSHQIVSESVQGKQSLRTDIQENSADQTSLLAPRNILKHAALANITEDSSLLAQKSSADLSDSNDQTRLIPLVNRAVNSFLHKF